MSETEHDDELLSAFLDDELTPEDRARVEECLAADPRARQLLDELRSVSRAMKELPRATLGADLRESVLQRAERAMLVPGERTSARGLNDLVRAIPFGRSKRSWFWAGAALAAGLMLMVFEREPGRNQDLPGEVAQTSRSKTTQNEPLSSLEFRAHEALREDADQLAESPPATTAPASTSGDLIAGKPAASPVELRDRELEPQVRQEAAPTGGASRFGSAMAGRGTSLEGESVGEDLLVVHVNVKPEALWNGTFDKLLVKYQIEVEEPAAGAAKLDMSQNVDVVLVEAAPAQIYSCLADLKKDESNYLGIAVDDRLATSQRTLAAEQSEADATQFSRGLVRNQRPVEIAPNNKFLYQTDRGPIEIDRNLADESDVTEPSLNMDSSGLANQNRAVRFAPQATPQELAVNQDSAVALRSSAADEYKQPAAAKGGFLSDEVQQNLARRASQKLATKANMLQVLFILSAGDEPAPASPASSPASSPPADDPVR